MNSVQWLVWGMELVGPAIGIVGRAKRGLAYPTNVYTLHKNRPALVYLPRKDVACASFTRGFDILNNNIIPWFSNWCNGIQFNRECSNFLKNFPPILPASEPSCQLDDGVPRDGEGGALLTLSSALIRIQLSSLTCRSKNTD